MQLLAPVFRPTRYLMGRLTYAMKFVVLGVVLLAPLVYVAHTYLSQQGAQISFSAKERVGVAYIEPLNTLLGRLVQARAGLSAERPPNGAAVDAAVAQVDAVAQRARIGAR